MVDRLPHRGHRPAVGGNPKAPVIQVATGETSFVGAVQVHSMQLVVEGCPAVSHREPEHIGILVHLDDGLHREVLGEGRSPGERIHQGSVEISKFVLLPAGLLGLPDESSSVFEEPHHRSVSLPGVLTLLDHQSARSGFRIRRHHFEVVLMTIGSIEEKFTSVGGPADRVDVLIGVVTDVDGHHVTRGLLEDPESRDRIRVPRLGIPLALDLASQTGQAVDQVIVAGGRHVEGVERQVSTVG